MKSIRNHPAFVNSEPISMGTSNGPLCDLRLGVKDLFHIQGLPTAAGNPDWLASHPIPQASNSSVIKLLSLGAQYVGKTLTDELAYSLNGQNIHYSDLVNPITPKRIVGGSSSGSAIAVANKLADIGLGTDTGGSIRVPASYNGLFGLRTSHGAIATDNMVALAPSFDTVGWMTPNIDILERVACALLPQQTHKEPHEQSRLLVLTNLIDKSEQANEIYTWLSALKNKNLIKGQFEVDTLNTSETFRVLQGYEIWQQHGEWINTYKPRFAKDINTRFLWCKQLCALQQEQARKQQQIINQALLDLFEKNNVLVIPTTPGRAPLLGESAENMYKYREDLMALTAIAGLAGLPQIHLPLFTIEGAPCGLSLIGKKNSDLTLITMARALISQNEPELLSKDST